MTLLARASVTAGGPLVLPLPALLQLLLPQGLYPISLSTVLASHHHAVQIFQLLLTGRLGGRSRNCQVDNGTAAA